MLDIISSLIYEVSFPFYYLLVFGVNSRMSDFGNCGRKLSKKNLFRMFALGNSALDIHIVNVISF